MLHRQSTLQSEHSVHCMHARTGPHKRNPVSARRAPADAELVTHHTGSHTIPHSSVICGYSRLAASWPRHVHSGCCSSASIAPYLALPSVELVRTSRKVTLLEHLVGLARMRVSKTKLKHGRIIKCTSVLRVLDEFSKLLLAVKRVERLPPGLLF